MKAEWFESGKLTKRSLDHPDSNPEEEDLRGKNAVAIDCLYHLWEVLRPAMRVDGVSLIMTGFFLLLMRDAGPRLSAQGEAERSPLHSFP